jgi:hypothetical protein
MSTHEQKASTGIRRGIPVLVAVMLLLAATQAWAAPHAPEGVGDATGAGLPLTPSWTAIGEHQDDSLGGMVASAGDVNGDGYSDTLIVTGGYDAPAIANAGRLELYYGHASGLFDAPDWVMTGDEQGAIGGRLTTLPGDFNCDGYDDVIAGASGRDHGETDEGMVFIWYGGAAGMGEDGTPLNADWAAEGNQVGAAFGSAAASAGDVNGDGCDDVLIGAYKYDNGQTDEGAVFVWYGHSDGPGHVSLGEPANADWMADSNREASRFASEWAGGVGDLNGDGFDDILVPDRWYGIGGAAFVWYGSADGPNLGVDGTPANADWTATSEYAAYAFGTAGGPAGDVNHDGYDDVILASPLYQQNGETQHGAAFIWYGSQGAGLGANSNLAGADWRYVGDQKDAELGSYYGAITAGDVNGDGFDDVMLDAWKYDAGEADEGRAFLFLGSVNGPAATPSWIADGNVAGLNFGIRVWPAWDLNGNGLDDVIISSYPYDTATITNAGRVDVYYFPWPHTVILPLVLR